LAAAAVQRHHQVAPEALAEGVVTDERLELPDELAVPSRGEVRAETSLERREVLLGEAYRLRGEAGVGGDATEGLTTPERHRLAQHRTRLGRVAGGHRDLAVADEDAKPDDVDVSGRDAQRIAGSLGGDHVLTK
jgi:hypothetical protein